MPPHPSWAPPGEGGLTWRTLPLLVAVEPPSALTHHAPHRAEAMTLSDCQQELSLVQTVTWGSRAFLSREETQHFVKE